MGRREVYCNEPVSKSKNVCIVRALHNETNNQ